MGRYVVICGLKNAGKTTLITRLLDAYGKKGMKVAVVKHDGHDFICDYTGTDTDQFSQHGAYGVACYSKQRLFVHEQVSPSEQKVMSLFPDADLLIIEGWKQTRHPKIELVRRGISSQPVSCQEGRFLIVSDYPKDHFQEDVASYDDLETIMDSIEQYGGEL